jgi:NDP-sugar pyrophosphorylase family protein
MSELPPVAILAGGLATRLRPLTETTPKAMVPVLGEPFVAHQLRLLKREGAQDVVMLLGYLGERVVDFVGDGSQFGLNVQHVFDGPVLLGTGGALRQALPKLGPEFIVLYGDSYLDVPMPPVVASFRSSGQPALLTVLKNDGQWDKSNARLRPGGLVDYAKRNPALDMTWIDFGMSVLKADVLLGLTPETAFDLSEVFERLSEKGQLAGFEVSRRFYEIGSFQGLAETEAYIREGRR